MFRWTHQFPKLNLNNCDIYAQWIALFKKKRAPDSREESPGGTVGEEYANKRRGSDRPSLDLWFEARKARTSIDLHNATTTHNKLLVSKAASTTLINKTYMVVKHLGTGTSGQVKLSFNLKDKKLYAIKACRKSKMMIPCLSRGAGVGSSNR